MSMAASSSRIRGPYTRRACNPCRLKKTKCIDGDNMPTTSCKTCEVRHIECSYDVDALDEPSRKALIRENQELTALVLSLRRQIEAHTTICLGAGATAGPPWSGFSQTAPSRDITAPYGPEYSSPSFTAAQRSEGNQSFPSYPHPTMYIDQGASRVPFRTVNRSATTYPIYNNPSPTTSYSHPSPPEKASASDDRALKGPAGGHALPAFAASSRAAVPLQGLNAPGGPTGGPSGANATTSESSLPGAPFIWDSSNSVYPRLDASPTFVYPSSSAYTTYR